MYDRFDPEGTTYYQEGRKCGKAESHRRNGGQLCGPYWYVRDDHRRRVYTGHVLADPGGQHVTTKRVGDTLTIEHMPNVRGLRIVDRQTGEAVFVPLSLARALSSALLGGG